MEQRGSRRPTYIQTTARKDYAFPARRSAEVAKPAVPANPPEEKTPPKPPGHKKNRLRFAVIGGVTLLVIIVVGLGFFKLRSGDGLPKSIVKSSNLTLYYPSELPRGYALDRSTAREVDGIVFFTIKDTASDRQIVFSEQVAPTNPPDFDAIQKSSSSLKKANVAGSQGVIGVYQSTPTAIILTNTTLINISGSKNTPEDAVANLVKSLRSLPN